MDLSPSEISRRFEACKNTRTRVEEQWRAVERLVMPFRGQFFRPASGESGVDWDKREIYDSTAIHAANNLASSLHGGLTTPIVRWFDLRFRTEANNQNPTTRAWLEDVAERIYAEIQQSNFNLETNEVYQDLVGYGTSAISLEEHPETDVMQKKWRGIVFKSIPIKEVYFQQGADGQPHMFFREMEWTVTQIVARWGVDMVPDKVKQHYESGRDPDKLYRVVFCIYPRHDAPMPSEMEGKQLEDSERPFAGSYVMVDEGATLLSEQGFYEMPVFLPRWRTTSDSMWGNSPAMVAMGDVITLNELKRLHLTAIEKVVDPALMAAERGLLSDFDLRPGSLNIVKDPNAVKPIESGANFQATTLTEQDLRASIEKIFYVDQLELKESPVMTATEVAARMDLMQRLLGPTMGRLQYDYLDKVINRTYLIMKRNGRLPPPPMGIDANLEMDVEYSGPMARAQKTDQVTGIQRFMAEAAQMAQIEPTVLDAVDFDAVIIGLHEALNLPASQLRDGGEVQALRAQRAKQQQDQQEVAGMEQGSKAVVNFADAQAKLRAVK